MRCLQVECWIGHYQVLCYRLQSQSILYLELSQYHQLHLSIIEETANKSSSAFIPAIVTWYGIVSLF